MRTKHEAIAAEIFRQAETASVTRVVRESELPEECPEAGIANFVFDAPREIGRRLGDGTREISRTCQIELVVTGDTKEEQISRFEAALVGYGQFLSALDEQALGVDHIEIGEPVEPDVIPMAGEANLRGAVIPIEILYETSSNPMETAP